MLAFLDLIKSIYPHDYSQVQKALAESLNNQRLTSNLPDDWYKKLHLYVTYPDSFHEHGQAGLTQLTERLDYIKELGCNAVHVLPFLSSPMIDAGFDISDYYIIRDDVGSNKEFDKLLAEAKKRGIVIFMDLVLNHVSEEHRWFQQAVSGDRFYRQFFEHSWKQPQLIERYSNQGGEWARYASDNGPIDIRIIFPEQCGQIPHWRQAEDGYWYYHTFYPQQPDINWHNYHVFIAYAKTMIYWAKKGVSFRLDAIPFVGKDIQAGQIETSQRTHQIVQALHQLVKLVAPDSTFLVEANQPIDKMTSYYGQEATQYRPEIKEAELAYNFPLMNMLWDALMTNHTDRLFKCIQATLDVPEWAGWVTFLRNHDELSLEYAPTEIKYEIYSALKDKGLSFRGKHDIAGRTASFLDNDTNQMIFAHTVLASLPGSPAIIFGDEIGKLNDYEFMKRQTEYKQQRLEDAQVKDDTRDINRGYLDAAQINQPSSRNLYRHISQIFKSRLKYIEYFATAQVRLSNKDYLRIDYPLAKKCLSVYLNFCNRAIEIPIKDRTLVLGDTSLLVRDHYNLETRSACWFLE